MILILTLCVGLAVAAWNTWQRLGRTRRARAWSRSRRDGTRRGVLVLYPLFALACVLGGVVGLAPDGPVVTVAALLMLAALLAFLAYFLLPLPIPSFLVPQWHARETATRGRDD